MLPVYRIRDGKDSIAKNQEIFEACYEIFAKGESVLIFPEGNHGLPRRVRPLSKGFTRIAYGFLDKYPDRALYIVPIGLNYTNILRPFRDVSLYYGKAFSISFSVASKWHFMRFKETCSISSSKALICSITSSLLG